MLNIDIYDIKKSVVGKANLREEVFSTSVKPSLYQEVIINQLANRRSGSASTKTRSFVRGGGKKPWKQKGTGRARVGSSRSPLWRGGAKIFGPLPRDYSYNMPKKKIKLALRGVLSLKLKNGDLIVLDKINIEKPKTKVFVSILKDLEIKGKVLILLGEENDNLVLSARNIPNLKILNYNGLNVYDLLDHDKVICFESELKKIEELLIPC